MLCRRNLLFYLLLGFFFIAGSQYCLAKETSGKPLKIGFIMVGPASDYGYNYAHNLGRLYLQKHLANVETTLVEKVPESSEVERVMEKMIAQGMSLIFLNSYGYLEPAERVAKRVAKRHPKVIIMQAWRPSKLGNIGTYAASQYEPLYAAGIVAGRMTKTNIIGMVCPQPVPDLLQNVNSLALGARSVNPQVRVKVIWTNSWSDPSMEAEAAKGLIESGADVIASLMDNPLAVAKTVEKSSGMLIGTQADYQSLVPNKWLTGSRWNWDHVYYDIAKSVQDGTWKKDCLWLGMKDGAVELCSFGKSVPASVRKEAGLVADQIKQAKKVVFRGPLKDRDGKERLNAGQIADTKCLTEMNWYVDGIEGTLPIHK